MTDLPILHVAIAGPITRMSMRLTLGERHCSGILSREPDRSWSLRWICAPHDGTVKLMAREHTAWQSAVRLALATCETHLIRRVMP